MKTIKSNKSFKIDLEDLIEDELNKKCKKKKKKSKKKKHKHSSKKSSHNKKNKKKITKKLASELGAEYFLFDKIELEQAAIDYESGKCSKKTFIDKVLDCFNLDTKVKINLSDESVATIVAGIVGIATALITRKK